MKRASISLVTFDLLAEKARDEAISAVIAYEKQLMRVRVKKAAQAARLHTVDTLIKCNVDGAIRRLAWQSIMIKRMEADPAYADKVLQANYCLFSLAGFYYVATERRLYDSKGYIIQL